MWDATAALSIIADGTLLVRVEKGGGLARESGRRRPIAGSKVPFEAWGSEISGVTRFWILYDILKKN